MYDSILNTEYNFIAFKSIKVYGVYIFGHF